MGREDVFRAGSLQIHPSRGASCFWLLVGGRELVLFMTQMENPSRHPHRTA